MSSFNMNLNMNKNFNMNKTPSKSKLNSSTNKTPTVDRYVPTRGNNKDLETIQSKFLRDCTNNYASNNLKQIEFISNTPPGQKNFKNSQMQPNQKNLHTNKIAGLNGNTHSNQTNFDFDLALNDVDNKHVGSGNGTAFSGLKPDHKILTFKEPAPAPREGHLNSLRCIYSYNKQQSRMNQNKAKHQMRRIPTVPDRTLDAPDLLDDYYLNLLSWSQSSNVLAVALGSSVYLWDAGMYMFT